MESVLLTAGKLSMETSSSIWSKVRSSRTWKAIAHVSEKPLSMMLIPIQSCLLLWKKKPMSSLINSLSLRSARSKKELRNSRRMWRSNMNRTMISQSTCSSARNMDCFILWPNMASYLYMKSPAARRSIHRNYVRALSLWAAEIARMMDFTSSIKKETWSPVVWVLLIWFLIFCLNARWSLIYRAYVSKWPVDTVFQE